MDSPKIYKFFFDRCIVVVVTEGLAQVQGFSVGGTQLGLRLAVNGRAGLREFGGDTFLVRRETFTG